jgi:hypothetical protein
MNSLEGVYLANLAEDRKKQPKFVHMGINLRVTDTCGKFFD